MTPAARLRSLLLGLAAVLALWAIVAGVTGGLQVEIGGLRVSSRSASRPAVAALVAMAVALWGVSAADRQRNLATLRRQGDAAAPALAVALSLALAATSAALGDHTAGGADASGYVSQSRHWGEGRMRLPAPALSDVAWPDRGWLVAPLGYAPSRVEGEIAPTYAPGLPWLMMLGAAVAGEGGRYVWTPLFVGLFVWVTFCLARREAPPLVALGAALLAGTSPPVLFAAMQTMSDLTAAALWVSSLLLVGSAALRLTLLSGVLAGIALVVRPNLVGVAAALWLAQVAARRWPTPAMAGETDTADAGARIVSGRDIALHALIWALPVAVAALAIAAVNNALWGAPTASGYGANADLFRADHIAPNLTRLWRWTRESGGDWTLVGVAAVLWAAARGVRQRAWPAAALVAAVGVSYLVYAVFEEWWYLRFYLPAWPVLAAAACALVWRLLAGWHRDLAPLVVLVAAVVIAAGAVTHAASVGTFAVWKSEQRYAAVAGYVATHAPPETVVLSVQHSGAIAYYSGRTVGRWDYVPPAGLDDFCARLVASGHAAWLVVDDWEEASFRRRFAGSVRGALDWPPLGELRLPGSRVHVYDLGTPTRATAPDTIPARLAWTWPWRRIATPVTAK